MAEKKKIDFEATLEKLQTSVRKLESGELTLEESLKEFENGIRLTRECQDYLKAAELKVEKLIGAKNGEIQTQPFDSEL